MTTPFRCGSRAFRSAKSHYDDLGLCCVCTGHRHAVTFTESAPDPSSLSLVSPEVLRHRRADRELPDRGVLACASARGRALIDRELYLPKSWTEDRQRCRLPGIDDSIEFAAKPELVQSMIERVLDAGVPFGWVTADAERPPPRPRDQGAARAGRCAFRPAPGR
uniref:Transposase IS701-like DDE domain-containing protein n=1 Tax=Rhodococcus sp. NS1 TaxID=402236 RepID=A0A097SQR2_9NOCA|nr:hypothetical protein LRS1606.425 [Rhodococcus sp. NS1]